MPNLRLLSYNVRSMRDDRAALARVIRSAQADVVLVQESPRFARWRSLCAQLARTSNMVVVGGGRPAGSNLVLSTLGVDVVATHDVLFSRQSGKHQRGTAIAVLEYRGSRFAVAGVHMSLDGAERARHLGELDAALSRLVPAEVPVIIGGDINDQPGSPVWSTLATARVDVFAGRDTGRTHPLTAPAAAPSKTIDGIFADRRIAVVSAEVITGPDTLIATDHLPVVAEFELP